MCPSDIGPASPRRHRNSSKDHACFHGSAEGRRDVVDRQLKPLAHSRSLADRKFVIDSALWHGRKIRKKFRAVHGRRP